MAAYSVVGVLSKRDDDIQESEIFQTYVPILILD